MAALANFTAPHLARTGRTYLHCRFLHPYRRAVAVRAAAAMADGDADSVASSSSSSDGEDFLSRIFVEGGPSLAPYVTTSRYLIEHMLRLADVTASDVLVRARGPRGLAAAPRTRRCLDLGIHALAQPRTCTWVHMGAHTPAHTLSYTHTCLHTRTQPLSYTHTHAYTLSLTHTHQPPV